MGVRIPYVTTQPADVGIGMEWEFRGAIAMLVTTLATAVIIFMGAILYPGLFSLDDGRIRYISDGFEDHRSLPYTSLVMLVIQVSIFYWFARQASMQSLQTPVPQFYLSILGSAGFASVVGMSMVAAVTRGVVHLTGAAIFIVFYLGMHYAFDNVLLRATLVKVVQVRTDEFFILVGGVFFFLFGGLLIAKMAVGDSSSSTPLGSMSAIAEYMVFLVFLVLNLFGMHLMTYVCVEYEVVPWTDQSRKSQWIPKEVIIPHGIQTPKNGNMPFTAMATETTTGKFMLRIPDTWHRSS